ncbi:MAG: hypothetical protein ACTSRP_28455 [Candidatus Helarchaeota archaeon]
MWPYQKKVNACLYKLQKKVNACLYKLSTTNDNKNLRFFTIVYIISDNTFICS